MEEESEGFDKERKEGGAGMDGFGAAEVVSCTGQMIGIKT